jgi:hypothetical protein
MDVHSTHTLSRYLPTYLSLARPANGAPIFFLSRWQPAICFNAAMSAPLQQQLLQLARRVSTIGITSLTSWIGYKANTDPIHIFWDLDHTILCSVTPLPPKNKDDSDEGGPMSSSSWLKPPRLDYFDQIDDDFPYNTQTLSPNTRTYIRPGAKVTLWLCSKLGICHVYTAAQESYTMNILREIDPNNEIFKGFVLHRSDYPRIVQEGKDLTVVMMGGNNHSTDVNNAAADRATSTADNDDDHDGTTTKKTLDGSTNMNGNGIRLERAILFDDKVSNFLPQKYENGVGVVPFNVQRLNKCIISSSSSSNENNVINNWIAYLEEVKEMLRLVGISVWGTVHLSGDVRKVVGWVRKLNG